MRTLLLGFREFRARPAVSAVAVITLALGLAGAIAMFAMLGAVGAAMVPPDVDPSRIGRVVWTALDENGGRGKLSAHEYAEVVAGGNGAFDSIAAWSEDSVTLGDDGPTLSAQRISPAFLPTLGFRVSAGRAFTPDEYRETATGAAIVSQSFLRRFPAHALGKRLRLGGADYTVVGILPDRQWYPAAGTDVWLPLAVSGDGHPRVESVWVTVRLRSPERLEQARSQLSVLTKRLTAGETSGRARKLSLITLKQDAGKRAGFGLVGLLGPSLVVLLIGCGNVANLLLARAARREQEMAVRAALGAGRWRLVVERLAESVWPALAGGGLGLGLAFAAVGGLRAWVATAPESRQAAEAIRIDARVLLFALAVTAVIPLVFGLVPALAASRPNFQAALHQAAGRRKRKRGPYGGRDLLVVAEVGLAVVLVVSAGMFGRFFSELGRIRWGFDPAKVVAVDLSLKHEVGATQANRALVEEIVAAIRQVPGVATAASGSFIGLDPVWRGEPIEFEACAAAPSAIGAAVTPVEPPFFATLGVRVQRGRAIEAQDRAGAPRVAVISQRHAERCWPGRDALGRRVRLGRGPSGEWATIVGVVPDALTTRAVEVVQPVYVPVAQVERMPSTVFVRAKGDAAALVGPLRAAVRGIDKRQPRDAVTPLEDRLMQWRSGAPLILGLIGGFGLFALTLAGLGVFSVISYMVAERMREFGIRIALGASRADLLRLVLGRAVIIIAIGAAVSIVGTLAVTHVTFHEMADLARTDYVLWAGVTALLALVAIVATIVPARGATRVEPMLALRAE